jgi:exodeoxyribonuclease VII large subunit
MERVTEHVSLSEFLHPLVSAVKSAATSTWVAAEISEYRDNHHVYITLVETNESGATIATLKTTLWASGKAKLLARFSAGTGGETLRKGIKILVLLKASLHPLYGLSATIENIDPTFTLGEAARKLIELRQRLQDEGIYDNQRAFVPPTEFTRVAVLCPPGAAGLGDFQSHADPLEAAGLCHFQYVSATFQGERTAAEIVAGLRTIYRAHRDTPFDAVVILRGGGAQADLAWLNEYEIAHAITKMPLPVLVAIGHERDLTILDEIANVSFHTPSKAIGFIAGSIVDNARTALTAFEAIVAMTGKTIALAEQTIERAYDVIEVASRHQHRIALDTVASCRDAITAGAHSAISQSTTSLDGQRATLQDSAHRQWDTAVAGMEAGIDTITLSTDKAVTAVEHGLSRTRDVIYGTVTTAIAVAEAEIAGHHGLIRDRSRLLVATVQDRVKAEAELVLGFGPAKTLERGFVMTKRKGKPLTRKAQVSRGERIELLFADGIVGATTD